MLLNAAKYQRYSFYRFWVIKGKPTGGGVKLPPPAWIRVKTSFQKREPKIIKYLGYKNFGKFRSEILKCNFSYADLRTLKEALFNIFNKYAPIRIFISSTLLNTKFFSSEIQINSLRARDGLIQPIFYKRFDCFSL